MITCLGIAGSSFLLEVWFFDFSVELPQAVNEKNKRETIINTKNFFKFI